MSNVQRVALGGDVQDAIEQADPNAAFSVLESAFEIQQREQRTMRLEEALEHMRGPIPDALAIESVKHVAARVNNYRCECATCRRARQATG